MKTFICDMIKVIVASTMTIICYVYVTPYLNGIHTYTIEDVQSGMSDHVFKTKHGLLFCPLYYNINNANKIILTYKVVDNKPVCAKIHYKVN